MVGVHPGTRVGTMESGVFVGVNHNVVRGVLRAIFADARPAIVELSPYLWWGATYGALQDVLPGRVMADVGLEGIEARIVRYRPVAPDIPELTQAEVIRFYRRHCAVDSQLYGYWRDEEYIA